MFTRPIPFYQIKRDIIARLEDDGHANFELGIGDGSAITARGGPLSEPHTTWTPFSIIGTRMMFEQIEEAHAKAMGYEHDLAGSSAIGEIASNLYLEFRGDLYAGNCTWVGMGDPKRALIVYAKTSEAWHAFNAKYNGRNLKPEAK